MEKVISTIVPTATIFGVPPCPNLDELSADIAFLGVPYDQGQLGMLPTGQKWGPKAVREQLKGYTYRGLVGIEDSSIAGQEEACGWYDVDDEEWKLRGVTMADCGDVNILPALCERNSDLMTNCDRMTEVMRKILSRGAFPVAIGGEHTLTLPVVRAFDCYESLDIVHFDAHLDFWDTIGGMKFNNADCIIRCTELPFVNHITQIGINPRDRWTRLEKEGYDIAVAYGTTMITCKKFRQLGVNQVVESIPKAKNIYVTIDIDCLDCSISPGMSGQEVGGLTYLDVEQTLAGIPTRGKVVGFDINGLLPYRDPTGITARVVQNLILDFLAYIFPNK